MDQINLNSIAGKKAEQLREEAFSRPKNPDTKDSVDEKNSRPKSPDTKDSLDEKNSRRSMGFNGEPYL